MSNKEEWLKQIRPSDTYRANFVEDLRASAAMLDGSAPVLPEMIRAQTARELAGRLRGVAQQLCDHARIQSGRCRYCELENPED